MNLAGDQIKDTYGALLNIGASGALSTLQPVTDGFGNVLPFEVSTTTFNFTGTVTGGPIGPTGAAGTSGTSGTSGVSGSSGTSGTDGTSGTSGVSGSSGTSGTSGVSGSSGTSGTSGVSGSSGTSGTDGTSGTSGINGATGPAGPTGAAAPGGGSPITVEQVNSLVSTAIGATATSGSYNSIAIGATATVLAPNQIAIGTGIRTTCTNTGQNKVAIGFGIEQSANFNSNNTIEIGCHTAGAAPLDGTGIIIGFNNNPSYGAGSITLGSSNSRHSGNSLTLGNCNGSWDNSIMIGGSNCVNTGNGGAIIVGCSNLGTNCSQTMFGRGNIGLAGNGIILGNCNTDNGGGGGNGTQIFGQNNVHCGVAFFHGSTLGFQNRLCSIGWQSCDHTTLGEMNTKIGDGTAYCHSLVVGSNNCVSGNPGNCTNAIGHYNMLFPGATGSTVIGSSSVGGTGAIDSIVLGNSACSTAANTIAIGSTAKTICQDNIAIGNTSCSCICEGIVIGKNAFAPKPVNGDIGSAIVIGQDACIKTGGSYGGGLVIGRNAQGFSYNAVTIGSSSQTNGEAAISLGLLSNGSADCSIAIGRSATASHTFSVAIGANITTERTNTVHLNSLIAYGQAASKAHSVGTTGGTVTLNWDNSNAQFVTLDSSISSLTKSNPIDGGVYTVFVTQGGTGSYTVAWGSDVKWAGGTGPVLSTAVGATDAVTLIYYAGITGYYGNANLNFA